MTGQPQIESFFDLATNTVTYLVADPVSGTAAVIDPVLDYEPNGGITDSASAEKIMAVAAERSWSIRWVLETHIHADHLTAARLIKQQTGARVAISERVREVQAIFQPMFAADDVAPNGGDFDLLLNDGAILDLGELKIEIIATPGHTPADVSYRIGDAVFVGDTMFMPDYGTARSDFPGGDARQLYRSIRALLDLSPETRLFTCHDYKAPGRDEIAWETTVAEQRATNVHVGGDTSEDEFVAMRTAKDAALAVPRLLLPAIQVNIRAGRFPPAEANGQVYLRIPVRTKG